MSKHMPRADRRQQIVLGALQTIASHGYARATIQRIAKQARITPGLIHYHFDSKQAILHAVLEELSSRIDARQHAFLHALEHGHSPALSATEDAAAPAITPRNRLDAFLHAMLSRDLSTPDADAIAAWVSICAEAVHDDDVQRQLDEVLHAQHLLLCQILVEEHRCQPHAAAEIATTLLATIQGIFLLSQTSPRLLTEGFALRQVRASIRGMLILAIGV